MFIDGCEDFTIDGENAIITDHIMSSDLDQGNKIGENKK